VVAFDPLLASYEAKTRKRAATALAAQQAAQLSAASARREARISKIRREIEEGRRQEATRPTVHGMTAQRFANLTNAERVALLNRRVNTGGPMSF
jgi:hypothetical protein